MDHLTPIAAPTAPLCEVCGHYSERCICPECPACHQFGNPECYVRHGLKITPAQEDARSAAESSQADLIAREEAFWRDYNSRTGE